MSARRLDVLAALAACFAGTGCAVLSPVPTWELVKAAGTATSVAVASKGAAASNTVYHLHAKPSEVCIEFNQGVPLADMLPALQLELKRHEVDSRVFPAGTVLDECAYWLRYSASVEWEVKPFASRQSRYLAGAALALQRADGRVLSSSEYDVGDGLLTGKWASTREKLAPVVTALLTGFEN